MVGFVGRVEDCDMGPLWRIRMMSRGREGVDKID
jgi:hypothetical protein